MAGHKSLYSRSVGNDIFSCLYSTVTSALLYFTLILLPAFSVVVNIVHVNTDCFYPAFYIVFISDLRTKETDLYTPARKYIALIIEYNPYEISTL